MSIDIVSMIIGGIIWEILKPYIFCKLIPQIKRSRVKANQNIEAEEKPDKHDRYRGTTMGFTSTLK